MKMIKLILLVFSVSFITVLGTEDEDFLRQWKEGGLSSSNDERKLEEEVSSFKNMDRISQLMEIKRKLMQALGGVNELYRSNGINSLEVKNQILGILRKVQTAPDDPDKAKNVFRQVSENLNHLVSFIPEDFTRQRQAHPHPEQPYYPAPHPEPEGKLGYLLSSVVGIVRSVKYLIQAII